MAIPVYVQSVTTYPGRTEWSDTVDYVVGDRVYTSDSISNYSVYVCIQDHSISGGGTPQQPGSASQNYWQAAGSREYPFLTGSNGNIYNHGYNATEFCVRNLNSFDDDNDPARYLSISDGSDRAHVILMDGVFSPASSGQSYMDLSNTDFFAENFQKSWFIFTYYDNVSTTENCPSFNHLKIGLHNTNVSFDQPIILNKCFVSTDSPYSVRSTIKATHRFNGKFSQFKDCLFDFSKCDCNLFMAGSTGSGLFGNPFVKNCTVIYNDSDGQYSSVIGNGNGNAPLSVDECIFYFKGTIQAPTPRIVYGQNANVSKSCFFGVNYVQDTFVAGSTIFNAYAGPDSESNLLNVDPLFIDADNGDYRLRPSSPLIGGLSNKSKRSQIEVEYPQGKWFDSSAAAGGDGTWDTPYNNYGEVINSFTGDEAIVLVKEGQHPLQSGYWNGSTFSYAHDLLKVYSNGIKFIGMGSGSVFDTSSNDIKNYGAFYSFGDNNPNSANTPFLFKDLDILMNNSGYILRGMICCRRAEYINVNTTQAPNLGATSSQLFDNTTSSGSGNSSGEYLKMTSCTINVSMSNNTSNTSFLLGSSGGLKQFSSCTFADLNRTTSINNLGSPTSFLHSNFGTYPGSYIKDCIIYSKNGTTSEFGTQYSSVNLDIKNVIVYSTQLSVSIGNKWSDRITITDPKLVATEPHDFDLRLRADSPAIGGISESKYSADTIWVNAETAGTGTGTESDPFHFNLQFLDAVNAAVSNGTFQVVFKDGNYRMTTSGEQLQIPNLGLVTLVAENKDQAIFSGERGINIGTLTSQA